MTVNKLGQHKIPCFWYQNIQDPNRPFIPLTATYNPELYPTYDNYDAIEVSSIKNIPKDYYGDMGVSHYLLIKHNPQQFEIVGIFNNSNLKEKDYMPYVPSVNTPYLDKNGIEVIWNGPTVNKKTKYTRLIIRRKQ